MKRARAYLFADRRPIAGSLQPRAAYVDSIGVDGVTLR